MKPLKYTVAALALIAVASFTQSAKAQNFGDLVLGVYDAASGGVANSYQLDLGAFNSLTNGETFNLGTTVATEFAGDSSANLQFNIAAIGVTGQVSGLSNEELAFTASTLPASISTSNASPFTDLKALVNDWQGTSINLPSSTSSNGTALLAVSNANSNAGSFDNEFVKNNVYGLGSGDLTDLEASFTNGTTVELYTNPNGSSTPTEVGTFSLSDVGGNEILTFDTVATPEPSAYALGLCAIALFFVLKRRSSVA